MFIANCNILNPYLSDYQSMLDALGVAGNAGGGEAVAGAAAVGAAAVAMQWVSDSQ